MKVTNTDHYLLADSGENPKRSAKTFELASLTFASISVIALIGLLF